MKLSKFFKGCILLSAFCAICSCAYADYAMDAKLEYNKGVELYQVGQFEQAAECFKHATELDPNYIDSYYNLGALLEYLRQDEEALNAFKQIILRKPDDYEAVYKAASISKKLGDFDKAKMYLTLIPSDSLVGQRAKQLADSINVDIPTEKEAMTPQPESYVEANPMNDSNGVYSDIPSPTGITADNKGNLYIAGFSDNTIYKIGPDNKKVVYLKNPKIDGPIGIARDNSGNLYIANYNKNNVLKFDVNGEVSEIISNVENPYCMYIAENLLFVSSQGSNSVIRFKLY